MQAPSVPLSPKREPTLAEASAQSHTHCLALGLGASPAALLLTRRLVWDPAAGAPVSPARGDSPAGRQMDRRGPLGAHCRALAHLHIDGRGAATGENAGAVPGRGARAP